MSQPEDVIAERVQVATRPADLPDYADPPVNEVVIGIQFEQLAITGAHVGLFWSGLRSDFPKVTEQPPLDPKIEILEPARFSPPALQFASWRGSRYWLMSEDEARLIQIHADRLILNWRRGQNSASYPHFEALQTEFHEIGEKWQIFVEELELSLRITQWEVSYINHVLTPNGQPMLADVLSFWSGQLDQAMGGTADAGRLEVQKILRESDKPWARMYVSVSTGIRSDQTPLIGFELTVRGPSEGEDAWKQANDRLFRARRQIVTAFDTLTTPKMHTIWGKRGA